MLSVSDVKPIFKVRLVEESGCKTIGIPADVGRFGIASFSISWTRWRALDFGGSSAVAYVLLILAVIVCVSFFNFVIRRYSSK